MDDVWIGGVSDKPSHRGLIKRVWVVVKAASCQGGAFAQVLSAHTNKQSALIARDLALGDHYKKYSHLPDFLEVEEVGIS